MKICAGLLPVVLAAAHVNGVAQAPVPSISVGDVRVSLGMSRDRVYRLFKDAHLQPQPAHQLAPGPNEEGWVICQSYQDSEDSPNCDIDGEVLFRDNIVIMASVRWEPKAESAASVVDAFIGATGDLTKRGLTHCEIGTDHQEQPSFTMRRMQIRCADHYSISISVSQLQNRSQAAYVDETISEKPLPLGEVR